MPEDKGYKTRTNKYKQDPFRPMPYNRLTDKSRRQHKPMGTDDFCIRKTKCKNSRRCASCVPLYKHWEEK